MAKMASVRLSISITATYKRTFHQLDIKYAFLHGDIQEGVYMEQPLSFIAQGESEKVCRLWKSLYALNRALMRIVWTF